jgi:hypothetical protein
MENVTIFYGHFLYVMIIWYILWLSGIIFSGFGMLYQEKSGNPAANFGC